MSGVALDGVGGQGGTDRAPWNPLWRRRDRRDADRTLVAGGHPRIVAPWRLRELTSAHEHDFLTAPRSPLYAHERGVEPPQRVQAILAAPEGARG